MKQYELTDHLGNVRLTFADYKYRENYSLPRLKVLSRNDYYPFGMLVPDNYYQDGSTLARFGFNGMERDDEIAGVGNSLNFGARQYDSRIARFPKLDRFKNKFHNLSPFAFAANTPINGIDKNGDSLYILAYVVNEPLGGNEMVKSAAITRKSDIEKSKYFDPKRDKVVLIEYEDLAELIPKVNINVHFYKEKYGNTVEFGIWSHSGEKDGPMGALETSKFPVDDWHMSMEGWGSINFNWDKNSENNRALFYGCNTSCLKMDFDERFTTRISKLENFNNVLIYGQPASSYPSTLSNFYDKDPAFMWWSLGLPGFSIHIPTYMVSRPETGSYSSFLEKVSSYLGNYVPYPMMVTKNGEAKNPQFQAGEKKNEDASSK